jgi:cyclic pyranopterin phosphate synthase
VSQSRTPERESGRGDGGECGFLRVGDGEQFVQAHEFEDHFNFWLEAEEGDFPAERFAVADVFHERREAGGIDVLHAGEIRDEGGRFLFDEVVELGAELGRAVKVDFALELKDAGAFFHGLADIHGLGIAGMRNGGKMNLEFRAAHGYGDGVEDPFGHRISYLRISVTDRCNERCTYCMPGELQEWLPREEVLSYEEIEHTVRVAASLGVRKLRVTGGEPLTRRGILRLFDLLSGIPGIEETGVSTNGTLLAQRVDGEVMAQALRDRGVRNLNVSLDTLDRADYAAVTGRDYLPRVLEGLDAAREAGFGSIRLNAVLVRGRCEKTILPLIDFAHERGLLLRFIELMPVSDREVLDDGNFYPVRAAMREIETAHGALIPEPGFRTNGPASYYRVAGRDQRVGFIGAMTDFHFCENCNKLRLTCDGKLRPCLGSHLEFDLREPLRAGATDEELREIFLGVVARKPKEHDFRGAYQPGRRMVAIGG